MLAFYGQSRGCSSRIIMKQTVSLLLALCLLCFCSFANAETVSDLHYDKNGFSCDIPVGWMFGGEDGDATFYFAQITGSENLAMLMILATEDDSLADVELTEEVLKEKYTEILKDAAASSPTGTVDFSYGEMAGTLSVIYCLRQELNGVMTSIAYENVLLNGWNFGIAMTHADLEPNVLAAYLETIGQTVTYTPPKPLSLEDLPTMDNPYIFVPSTANGQNFVTAMWMDDGSTRALCTLLLTLGLDLSDGSLDSTYPMNIYASLIGCEDDIVRTIIPSADGTFGYFIEYDTIEGIAQFWGVPWDEENLNAFAASCPDQIYENQQDALDYVVQLLWEAISNPQ